MKEKKTKKNRWLKQEKNRGETWFHRPHLFCYADRASNDFRLRFSLANLDAAQWAELMQMGTIRIEHVSSHLTLTQRTTLVRPLDSFLAPTCLFVFCLFITFWLFNWTRSLDNQMGRTRHLAHWQWGTSCARHFERIIRIEKDDVYISMTLSACCLSVSSIDKINHCRD